MERRTFLKQSVAGIGTLAGIHSGILSVRGERIGGPQDGPASTEDATPEIWGVNAAALKAPWSSSHSIDDLLADESHTLILKDFFRVGGASLSATPTECRVSYSDETLFVLFRCEESNMSFPYTNLNPESWREADWNSLHGLPSGCRLNWPPYPDEVDVLIQPDPAVSSYYQFAVSQQGAAFGRILSIQFDANSSPDQDATNRRDPTPAQKVGAFQATVVSKADAWIALFHIPWTTLGGKPGGDCFGFLPMRTRWREGEFSSPVALDVNESMPVDLLIEMRFSGDTEVKDRQNTLCQLPSGALRWQRPAIVKHPDQATCRQIWEMANSLGTPTNRDNLGQRLLLTQRWMDLMMLEGFTPLPRAWGDLHDDLTIEYLRQKVNAEFQKKNHDSAYKLLDNYLHKLDEMSRWWYADGSPANILKSEWTQVTSIEHMDVQDSALLMKCMAGDHKVNLSLALPATGGVRIYGDNQGYWRPDDLLPLHTSQTTGSCKIQMPDGAVIVDQKPFAISFYDAAGNKVAEIGRDCLSFRFNSDGAILAVDFRSRLDPNEVIYGFGEKYDRFNENGNVLTLWGTDDWIGNGMGLANTTYKPLPIFHSSKGYMVFNNSSYRLRGDIGNAAASEYRITQHGPTFDYYFLIGAPQKNLQSYTAFTGRVPLPPKWVFEPWMGRGGGAWAEGHWGDIVHAMSEEERVTLRYAELDIPHSAIYAEGPTALSSEINHFMADRGIRVLGYFMPAVPVSRQHALMPDLKSDQLPVLRNASGAIVPGAQDNYIDFTNPKSRELCRRYLREALDLGQAGSMVDYGDMTPDDAVFYSGQRGAEMHNSYYYDYQRTISEAYQEKRGNDFILYARGAAPGTQRWVGQFAGDHPANFNGLRHVLTGALNLCACGYSNWGSDLGGYFGFPQPAVYMRWFQFGCFSPLMRPHGTAPRDPWFFGEAAVTNYKFLAWTRENLINYIYNSAAIAHNTGVPLMRSMAVSFPGDQSALVVNDQYMFGPELLVAPVTTEDTFRTVHFPAGTWTSLWNGHAVSGPVTRKIEAPLDTIPVYLRPTALMPVQLSQEMQFGKSMTAARVSALVATLPEESRTINVLNERGENATIDVQVRPDRFIWNLTNLPETDYLLLYGRAEASMVKVNGKTLSKSAMSQPSSIQEGWVADKAGNRLIISISRHDVEQSNAGAEIEVYL